MGERSGPFWDAVEGRAPLPPAAATLGLKVVDVDPEAGTIELEFAGTEAFTNPAGNVLGGFVAAMLFDTVGPALLATVEPDQFQTTSSIAVQFLRSARPGKLVGRGGPCAGTGTMCYSNRRCSTGTGPSSRRRPRPLG
jgi:uncharacterized protein (TIGR00369 family)